MDCAICEPFPDPDRRPTARRLAPTDDNAGGGDGSPTSLHADCARRSEGPFASCLSRWFILPIPFRLMKRARTYRWLLAGIVFASIGLVLAVSGCGSSSETSRPNGAYSRALTATKEGGEGSSGERARHSAEKEEAASRPHAEKEEAAVAQCAGAARIRRPFGLQSQMQPNQSQWSEGSGRV